MMSGKNYPTFGMAVVVYELISMHTNKSIEEATSQYTADFATAFQNKLEDYSDIVNNREAKIAAVLDPRAKLLLPKFVGDMSVIKRYVRDEYEAQYRTKFESQHQTLEPQMNQHEEQDVALGIALYQLIDDTFGADEPATHAGESFASELDRWLGHHDHKNQE
ncbi:hypothetical protein AM588_10002579 [Phytophthora nicotianae]|uniref:Uncharacterized protein n=1 Tax=Phytophthora nicotianae TaxID=4792 RepID=A0A0W8CSE3_PHYNI|nr:hypothetical protein AM588_10002579 [Phytophthora nicotianae]